MNKNFFLCLLLVISGFIYYFYKIEPNQIYLNNHYVTEDEPPGLGFFIPLTNSEELLELAPHLEEKIKAFNLTPKEFEKYTIWYGSVIYEKEPYFEYGLQPYELVRVTNHSLIFKQTNPIEFEGDERNVYHISEYLFRTSSNTKSLDFYYR